MLRPSSESPLRARSMSEQVWGVPVAREPNRRARCQAGNVARTVVLRASVSELTPVAVIMAREFPARLTGALRGELGVDVRADGGGNFVGGFSVVDVTAAAAAHVGHVHPRFSVRA